jgi:hypothetical protein
MVDVSVKDAMDALGNELMNYLKEAGEQVTIEEKVEAKPRREPGPNMLEPFTALFGGFKEMLTLPFGGVFSFKEKDDGVASHKNDKGVAKAAAAASFQVYKNYKKGHLMPAW